jgi:hypothetical protein
MLLTVTGMCRDVKLTYWILNENIKKINKRDAQILLNC